MTKLGSWAVNFEIILDGKLPEMREYYYSIA